MKYNNNFKIKAFTLAEMTLVLLITSVIAASVTPIITSRIARGAANSMFSPSSPWKTAVKYTGGGIYNDPLYNYSFIGIGFKPDGVQPGFPAFAINSSADTNFMRAPQILIKGRTDATSDYNIAADAFGNIAIVSRNDSFGSLKSTDNKISGGGNIYLGQNIQNDANDSTKVAANNSVYMGYSVNSQESVNAINIGQYIKRNGKEQNSVNIGSYLYAHTADDITSSPELDLFDSINIGRDTNSYGYGSYNINIGSKAARFNYANKSIAIGQYAGNKNNLNSKSNYENIMIGSYAGSLLNDTDIKKVYEISIGKYAGANSQRSTNSMLNIGNYAGYSFNVASSSNSDNQNHVAIGDYAAANLNGSNTDADNVYIGYKSGYDSKPNVGNLNIGAFSGAGSETEMSATSAIGYYAGYNAVQTAGVLIGSYAGYNSSGGLYNIFIGSHAGQNSKGKQITGIGYHACEGAKNNYTWCLGSYRYKQTLKVKDAAGAELTVWDGSKGGNDSGTMFIGFNNTAGDDNAIRKQTITLYASSVYRIGLGKTGFDSTTDGSESAYRLSDRRFKKNIVPSNHSLNDIRKINIYDYNLKDDAHKTPQIGIIAQEYRKIFPHDVSREPYTKKLAASTDWMFYTMVNAVKDLDKEVQSMQRDFQAYVKDYMGLKSKVAKLEQQANQIETENAQMRSRLAKINGKLNNK